MRTKEASQFLIFLGIFLIVGPSFAQKDVEGSKDHPIISRYPGSYIYFYDQKEFDEFEILLGPEKIFQGDDYVKKAKKERTEGKVTRIGYQAPKNRSVFEVFKNYEEAVKKANFDLLYSASGKDFSISDFLNHYFRLRAGWSEDKSFYLSARNKSGNVMISICVLPGWDGPVALVGIVEKKEMEMGLIKAKDIYEKIKSEGKVAIYGIYFDFDKAEIKPESKPAFEEIAAFLKAHPEIKLYIVGHTDNIGRLEYNFELSKRRAEAVMKELVEKYGISGDRLKAFGVGPLAPVASNSTEEGRAKNRRVELVEQ